MPVAPGMPVWPGDPEVRARLCSSIAAGDGCDVTALVLSTHTGTHIDAPAHFVAGAAAIDAMPMELMTGRALVVQVEDEICIRPEHLPSCLKRGDRVLFRTPNSMRRLAGFDEDFVYVSAAAATALAEAAVALVGIDYLSVGGFHTECVETHLALLAAGIWLVEGLHLAEVPPGVCEFICLPLRIAGADGAPARALVGV
jgi:arylformamidase